VLISASADMTDSGREGIHIDELVTGHGSASTETSLVEVETTLTRDITMCNVALVSCHTGAIDHNAVYGLLIECLQDVNLIPFALHRLVVCYLESNFRLFSNYIISLMKDAEKIIAEESGESLQKRVAELEEENS
jgi:hypothetical protein